MPGYQTFRLRFGNVFVKNADGVYLHSIER